MIILGIGDSHESHACILKDGQLIAAISEERLSRLKGDGGYPERAIECVLKLTGIDPNDIDHIAIASRILSPFQIITNREAVFSVMDWVKLNREYWKPKLIENKNLPPFWDIELFKQKIDESRRYSEFLKYNHNISEDEGIQIFNKVRKKSVMDHLEVQENKISFYRHEDCHKAYAFYSSPYPRSNALVFSVEGQGDDSSATISTIQSDGRMTEHWRSNDFHVGRVFRLITLLLGMKPAQHEYKVMGLAPYGTEYYGRRSLELFRTINRVVGTEIRNTHSMPDLYFSIRDSLEGERFDGIAWGLQKWLEELLTEWCTNNCRAYEIDNVLLTGGVAQNIKACKAVWELSEVARFWVGPVSGDGSLGIGAAWLASMKLEPSIPIVGLQNVYLGTSAASHEIDKSITKKGLRSHLKLFERPSNPLIAQWLAEGHVVARFSGRMEFGARALGNRSILADPRYYDVVDRINRKIKSRDFWMPFTPSMLYEESERILINPKQLYSPFMTVAFDMNPEYRKLLPATIHPADKTTRPQMLRQEDNPTFYDLIHEFKKQTGVGVILNTSFNLHGDAIVESPEDAVRTFLNSDLDILVFDNVAISRVHRI
jgi:carbamoyltransferase|tara:strand:+ start:3359 stop:5158 length:1800 start_codon:yes stop_codon:yes gene_type:complete